MEVGVRELKDGLSRYLELAAAGTPVTITERGRPKALLVPLPVAHRLDLAVADGLVRAPVRRYDASGYARPAPVRDSAAVLADDRDDDRAS